MNRPLINSEEEIYAPFSEEVREGEPKEEQPTPLSQPPRENSGLVAVLALAVVLFVSALAWSDPGWQARLAAEGNAALVQGQYERLFTSIGVHADARHFLANAVLLVLFAYLLFGYFGVVVFPILTVPIAALTTAAALYTYPPHVRLIGASGLVYVMAAFWLTMYVLVETARTLKRRLFHVLGITLIVLVPSALQQNVSYRTHAIGFALGALAAAVYYLFYRQRLNREKMAAVQPDYEDFPLE